MKLPTTFTLKIGDIDKDILEELEEFVSDYISDETGFCHEGFQWDITINVSKVKWDVDED